MAARFRRASFVVRWRATKDGPGWVLERRGSAPVVGWRAILDQLSEEGWELVTVVMTSWEIEHVVGEGLAPQYPDAFRLFVKQPA